MNKFCLIILSINFLLISNSALAQSPSPTPHHVSPSASEISDSIARGIKALRDSIYASANNDPAANPTQAEFEAGTIKIDTQVDVSQAPASRGIKLVVTGASGASGSAFNLDVSASNPLGQSYKKIVSTAYPAGAPTMALTSDWRSDSSIAALLTEIQNVMQYCNTQVAATNPEYWFEFAPLHLYCQSIFKPNLQSYYDQLNVWDKSSPTDTAVPGPGAFAQMRDYAAAEVAIAAIVFDALKHIDQDTTGKFMHNTARCFPAASGKMFVEKVLGSAGITFTQQGGVVSLSKVDPNRLPEPNYALGGYNTYYTGGNNAEMNLLFNNMPAGVTATSAPSFTIDNSSYNNNLQFNFDGVLNFHFRLREVQQPGQTCKGAPFCSHPYTPRDAVPNKSS